MFDELTPQQKLWEWESKSIQVIGTGNDILSFRVPSYEDVTYWVLLDEISLTATVSATNRLCGFLGDDILVGNSTTVDQFLYRAGMGNDTIRNFGSNDTILLDQSLGITWSNLKNLGVQDGADCYFQFDLENSLRIEDTNLANLDVSQFISCDLTDTATLNALVQD